MSASTGVWTETISRGAAISLMQNFTSVAGALRELVDNPIDYRWGQLLTIDITVDKQHDRLVVESDGGRGMGAEEIQTWLNWGGGEEHDSTHIGRWHQGGKAACGFLGQDLSLWAKRLNSDEVWFLNDEGWSNRPQPRDFGVPTPLPKEKHPPTMKQLPRDRGHVRIEMKKLVKDKRWKLETLKQDLGKTYRSLLERGDLCISINGEKVSPLPIPLSTAVTRIQIETKLSGGKSVSGWAGRMKREQLTYTLKSGLMLVHNGRLIMEGEWFGYNHEGKGTLNSLVGELHMTGFTPVLNKTDFSDRGSEVWDELERSVLVQLAPLFSELRKSGEEPRVTKREKELAREVAEELEQVFAALQEMPESGSMEGEHGKATGESPGGRKRPEPRGNQQPVQNPRGSNGNPSRARTPPPPDPVGSLARLLEKITGGSHRPPLRVKAWDPSVRSAWTDEGSQAWLDLNRNYPLYGSLNGAKAYLAETAILELCRPGAGQQMDAAEYVERVNLMVLKWSQLVTQAD